MNFSIGEEFERTFKVSQETYEGLADSSLIASGQLLASSLSKVNKGTASLSVA